MSRIVSFQHSGEFKPTIKFLNSIGSNRLYSVLESYAKKGVEALSEATPRRTGRTASSWGYEIIINKDSVEIYWTNDRKGSDGTTPVAILIQQGHGTRRGAYVEGIDYINPALEPIFNDMADAIWSKVVNA